MLARVGYTLNVLEAIVIDIAYTMNMSHALFDVPAEYLARTAEGIVIRNYQGSLNVAVGLRL